MSNAAAFPAVNDAQMGAILWAAPIPTGVVGQRWSITHSGGTVVVTIHAVHTNGPGTAALWFVTPAGVAWAIQTVTETLVGPGLQAAVGGLSVTGSPVVINGKVVINADAGSVTLTGQPADVIAKGVAVSDPFWNNVSFILSYDGDPIADVGPRRITVTDVGTPRRTVPAVGPAAGAYNQLGSSSSRRWVIADRKIAKGSFDRLYWEFEAASGGPARFASYVGVVSQQQLDDAAKTFDSNQDPTWHGSLSYHGSGTTRGNGNVFQLPGDVWGAGDVVMIAFDAHDGGFWIGKNGTWETDPATEGPVRFSDDVGEYDFWPVVQATNAGEGGELKSLTSQFSYSVPTGFKALGFFFEEMQVLAAPASVVAGGVPNAVTVLGTRNNVILGATTGLTVLGTRSNVILGATTGLTVKRNSTFAIVE